MSTEAEEITPSYTATERGRDSELSGCRVSESSATLDLSTTQRMPRFQKVRPREEGRERSLGRQVSVPSYKKGVGR